MWRNWNLNLPVNQLPSDSDEDNYESPVDEDPNNLVSPNRPHQSPSASPRALLRPDPPLVEEVLENVGQQLRTLPDRQGRADRRNAVRAAAEAAQAANEAVEVAEDRNESEADIMVEFDAENGNDGDKAQEHARSIKVEFAPSDINFWFTELEAEMLMASVKSQWLKKTILQRNLPTKQKADVKSLLTLTKAQAGDDIYLKIKTELVRVYAAKPQDSYKRALTRTMVGLPSQLGAQIVEDVCKKPNKMSGCCCAAAVLALWSDKLPVNVRAHISNSTFDATTYKDVFEAADKVYLASKQVSSVAAIQELDETQAAFEEHNQPQVAAIKAGNKGGGNNSSGGSGTNKGGGQGQGKNKKNKNNKNNKPRGPRHASQPPEQCCDRHYVHGADAWYCLAPSTCPWVSRVSPKP